MSAAKQGVEALLKKLPCEDTLKVIHHHLTDFTRIRVCFPYAGDWIYISMKSHGEERPKGSNNINITKKVYAYFTACNDIRVMRSNRITTFAYSRFSALLLLFMTAISLPTAVLSEMVNIAPAAGKWAYTGNRCEIDKIYADEYSAIQGGIDRYNSYCNDASIYSIGNWGAPENQTTGPCGSTQKYPKFVMGVEQENTRQVSVQFCGSLRDGWTVSRNRSVYCPSGYSRSGNSCMPNADTLTPKKNLGGSCSANGIGMSENSQSVGNPVNLGNGNKFQSENDYISIKPSALGFTRYYNSHPAVESDNIGNNWRHTYSRSIRFISNDSDSTAMLLREDGKAYYFTLINGFFVSDSDINSQLNRVTDAEGNLTGWEYLTTTGTLENYDVDGQLISIINQEELVQSLEYDPVSNRLLEISDNAGGRLDILYNAEGKISFLSDRTGHNWSYRYDGNGNLEYVIFPDGTPGDDTDNPRRQYHYNEPAYTSGADLPNALTGITDERGIRYATYDYHADGRAKASYHAGNAQRVDIAYNDNDGSRIVTNSKGQTTTYSTAVQLGVALVTDVSGPGCSTCGSGNTIYNYDPLNNNLLYKTENGSITEYGNYDTNGYPGFMIEANGTAEHRRTDYAYDSRFYNKITNILEPSVFAADPTAQCIEGVDCRKTEYTYDDWGNRLTETFSGFTPDGTPVSRTTTYQYDGPLHQLSQIDGPRTDVDDITTFEYYPDDPTEVANRARLKRVTAADGTRLRDAIEYTPTGKVSFEYRPNNILIDHVYYPGNDRLKATTAHDLSTGNTSRTAWTYLPTGEVESITTASLTPDATMLTFGYDPARRLVRITDGMGNYIKYTLDAEGNREKEEIFDANGTLQDELDDVLKKALNRTFDAYNRLDISKLGADPANPLEQVDSDFAPDGTLDRQIDGNGVVNGYSYDNLKRLLSGTQDLGGLGAVTRYRYDAADNLVSVTDPVNGNTSYVYDDLGNLLTTTSPDTGTTVYTYDAAGNVQTRQDARGQVFTYSYDALNRLTGVDAPGTADDITYSYDNCANGIGQLCSVTQDSTVVTYAYDAFGNVTAHQQLAYTYDAANRIKTVTYPSGAVVTYRHDAAGQVSQVTLTADGTTTTLASGISYAPFGAVTDLVLGNGATLTQDLDTAYRLTSQSVSGALDLGYTRYDGNGNLRSRTDMLTSSSDFAYDTLNRLDTGSGPFGARDYNYDLNGNRTQLIGDGLTTSYGYTPRTNRLSTENGWTYTLDANGNTTHKLAGDGQGFVYTYSSHNRLITAAKRQTTGYKGKGKKKTPVIGDAALAHYSYNGLGQRVSKTRADGTVTQFLYGTDGVLLAELDDSAIVQREYVYLNGELLVTIAVSTTPGGSTGGGSEMMLDNGAAGTSSTGTWTPTSDRKNKQIGSDYLVAAGGSNSTHRWTPVLTAGSQEVFAWWIKDRKASTTAPFTIVHGNGTSTVTVNQTGSSAQWVSLGVYDFTGNGTEYVEVSDAYGKAIADAVRFVEQPTVLPQTVSTNIYYVHNDHLGTPQVMTDETGAMVWRAIYDPLGNATVDAGSTAILNVRFPGQYSDAETGLHYNGFRYYDPSTGRYITADPIGLLLNNPSPTMLLAERSGIIKLPSDISLGYINQPYTYVANNPLRYIDDLGLHHKPNHPWNPPSASQSLGDYLSETNGNMWGEFTDQDGTCSLGLILSSVGDACFPERCQRHDACFADYECNSSSWLSNILGGTKVCNKCNSGFFD